MIYTPKEVQNYNLLHRLVDSKKHKSLIYSFLNSTNANQTVFNNILKLKK